VGCSPKGLISKLSSVSLTVPNPLVSQLVSLHFSVVSDLRAGARVRGRRFSGERSLVITRAHRTRYLPATFFVRGGAYRNETSFAVSAQYSQARGALVRPNLPSNLALLAG